MTVEVAAAATAVAAAEAAVVGGAVPVSIWVLGLFALLEGGRRHALRNFSRFTLSTKRGQGLFCACKGYFCGVPCLFPLSFSIPKCHAGCLLGLNAVFPRSRISSVALHFFFFGLYQLQLVLLFIFPLNFVIFVLRSMNFPRFKLYGVCRMHIGPFFRLKGPPNGPDNGSGSAGARSSPSTSPARGGAGAQKRKRTSSSGGRGGGSASKKRAAKVRSPGGLQTTLYCCYCPSCTPPAPPHSRTPPPKQKRESMLSSFSCSVPLSTISFVRPRPPKPWLA